MDDAEEREIYPPSESTEQAWTWLRQHVAWAEGFWLVIVFTESPPQAHVLQRRLGGGLGERGKQQRILRPSSPEELRAALDRLDEPEEVACTWLEAVCRDPLHLEEDGEPWTAAWEHLLLRANERRERLREQRRGVVLVARGALKPLFREAAPDLWSVHTKVLELQSARVAVFERELEEGIGAKTKDLRSIIVGLSEALERARPELRLDEAESEELRAATGESSVGEVLAVLQEMARRRTREDTVLFELIHGLRFGLRLMQEHRFRAAAEIFLRVSRLEPAIRGAEPMIVYLLEGSELLLSYGMLLDGEYEAAAYSVHSELARVRLESEPNDFQLMLLNALNMAYWVLGRWSEVRRIEGAYELD